MTEEYLSLEKLGVYKLARRLSKVSWKIYEGLDWQDKKEGYGRFHYLDKVKFYYNARGSLLEARHWFELLVGRGKVKKDDEKQFLAVYSKLKPS